MMMPPRTRTLAAVLVRVHLLVAAISAVVICGAAMGAAAGRPPAGLPPLRKSSSFPAVRRAEGYDYIIVGGGTAGCPLAATLSERFKVLLLERGDAPYWNRNVTQMENFHIGLADLSPSSPSNYFISTDGVINTRARVLGGGSCINAGFYSRASPSYVKKAGWDGALVNASYPWVEEKIVQWPELSPWQTALRDGLLQAGVSPFNGYTYDHVDGTKVGGTIFDSTGYRHTAADLLAAGNASNLHVLLHATVQKIIFRRAEHGRNRQPRAVAVLFKDETGRQHRAILGKNGGSEVILSAGAIGSPHLLMLSGIGPKQELRRQGVAVVLDNRYVGKGMSDNPMNAIFIPSAKPVKQSLIETVGIISEAGVFIEASSGFGESRDSIHCHHGIMSAEVGQLTTVPPKQRTLEAAQRYRDAKASLPREVFWGGFVLEKIDGPLSKGGISLLSSDIDTTPAITFNYFRHPRDLARCVYGIRTIEKIVQTNRFAGLPGAPGGGLSMERLLNVSVQANVNLIPKHTNDTTSLEQFCRDTVTTIWHYHGGCAIGRVVDRDYRVLSVKGLRVVDGSTFHSSPGTNPQATVMMLGRYVGVKILRERLGGAAGV